VVGYRDPQHVRSGLERVFRYMGAPAPDVVIDLGRRWGEIVGPAMAEATRPMEVVDGRMVVACNDPAWVSQVGWMERQIIARIVEMFPDTHLTRVSAKVRSDR